MPLDPQFKPIVELYRQMPALDELPLASLRGAPPPENPEPTAVDEVFERVIDGPGGPLRLRIYCSGEPGDRPLLLFMHGGGFVLGDLDTHDELGRSLSAGAAAVVVSVEYRLAPENPYPAASDDCLCALRWASVNAAALGADAARIIVTGDSAGGNLAAVTALRARDEGGPALAGQVLIYPTADLSAPMQPAPDGEFYILSPRTRKFFNEAYLSDPAQIRLPTVSPLCADSLAGLPPVLLITAEYDPLCEQGEALASRYQASGVETTHTRYDGAIHGFVTFPTPMAAEAVAQISGWIRSNYGGSEAGMSEQQASPGGQCQ